MYKYLSTDQLKNLYILVKAVDGVKIVIWMGKI